MGKSTLLRTRKPKESVGKNERSKPEAVLQPLRWAETGQVPLHPGDAMRLAGSCEVCQPGSSGQAHLPSRCLTVAICMNATGSLKRAISKTKGVLLWPQNRTQRGRRGEARSYFKARPFVRIQDILSLGFPHPPKEELLFETNLYTSSLYYLR